MANVFSKKAPAQDQKAPVVAPILAPEKAPAAAAVPVAILATATVAAPPPENEQPKGTVDVGELPAWISDALCLPNGEATGERLRALSEYRTAKGTPKGCPWGGSPKGENMSPGAALVVWDVSDGYILLSDGSRVSTREDGTCGKRYSHVHHANSFRSQVRDSKLSSGERLVKRLSGVATTVAAILADHGHIAPGSLPGLPVGWDTLLANVGQASTCLGNAKQVAGSIPTGVKFPPPPAKGQGPQVPLSKGDVVIFRGERYLYRGEHKSAGMIVILPPEFGKDPDAFPLVVERKQVKLVPTPA